VQKVFAHELLRVGL